MSACWGLCMPPTAKSVLISLADNANDEGYCWPSISTISERTCFSERAVQNAIKWLEEASLVKANRDNGRHTTYVVTPASYSPPQQVHPAYAAQVPPQQMRQPPQEIPKPPQQVPSNRNKPSRTVNRTVNTIDRPDDVCEQVWQDWLKLRKTKKAAVSDTVIAGIRREALKARFTLEEAMRESCERGWQGFKAEWVTGNNRNNNGSNHAQPKLTPAERIAVGIALNNGGEIPSGYENNGNVVAEVGRNLRSQVDGSLRNGRNGISGADLGEGIKWVNGSAGSGRPEGLLGEF